MKKFVQLLGVILSLIFVLSACGTSNSEEKKIEEKIESVTHFLFTAPNEKIAGNEVLKTAITVEEITAELKTLFPDLTEICTDSAISDLALPMGGMHIMAMEEDIVVTVQSTEVEVHSEKNNTYAFTCVLVVEGNGKSEIEVSGKVQLDENGKISYVDDDAAVNVLTEEMIKLM